MNAVQWFKGRLAADWQLTKDAWARNMRTAKVVAFWACVAGLGIFYVEFFKLLWSLFT